MFLFGTLLTMEGFEPLPRPFQACRPKSLPTFKVWGLMKQPVLDLKDDEGSPKVVLTTRISSDDIYQRQQGTLV